MKNLILLALLACLVIVYSCSIFNNRPLFKTKIPRVFCGEFASGNQNKSECDCNSELELDASGNLIKVQPDYRWFDRFGNKYCNLLINNPCIRSVNKQKSLAPEIGFESPNTQSMGGLFDLYFSDIQNGLSTGFGSPSNSVFIDVISQVFSDLDVLLVHPETSCGNPFVPVNIEVQSINSPGSGILGSASSYYDYQGETTGIKHNEVWKAINEGANNPNEWDGIVRINLGYSNWYLGYDGATPSGQVDLYTVVLHEVLHAMGFASLINEFGASKHQLLSGSPTLYNYSIFDKYLKFDNSTTSIDGQNLVINASGYENNYNPDSDALSDLKSGCQNPSPVEPDIIFIGENNTGGGYIYAPNSWSNGSSLSHFESNCDGTSTSNFVMNPSISTGVSRRITDEEVHTLCDIGYQISGTYGTSILDVGGGTNPNLIDDVPTCGQLFAAVDDKGACCQGTTFKVDYCSGNTLVINPDDLICNDVYSGSVTVIDFEVISSGGELVWSSPDYIFTPTELGQTVLRYRLEDADGVSNYAYVFIDVVLCPDFNCVNTSPCNLICNPDLIDDDSDCVNDTPCNWHGTSANASCMEGWRTAYRSPDYINDGSCDYLSISPGGKIHIYGGSIYSETLEGEPGEGMVTSTFLENNKKYIFSTYLKKWTSSLPPANIEIGLVKSVDIEWTSTGILPGVYPNQNTNVIEGSLILNGWQQYVRLIEPLDNYDLLLFLATSDGTFQGFTLFDKVELIEDKINDIQTNHSIQCGQTITIGDNLCTITNMNYSWWDVTNSDSPVQLTDGIDLIGTGVSIPISNTNGSQLQVSPASSIVYELRRRFISTNGFAIATNNCDAEVQVNVEVNVDISLEKTLVSSNPIPAGEMIQFQVDIENGTGGDLTNIEVDDLLDNNLIAGSLSVIPNSNITHTTSGQNIEFIILNLPDGESETITYSVLVDLSTPPISLTNCASLNYAECEIESCIDFDITDCVNFDLVAMDSEGDVGIEPNAGEIWQGNIWNCVDDPDCMEGENPEYKMVGTNILRVRVDNLGCLNFKESDKATLHVYWTIGRPEETWSDHWLDIPSNIIDGTTAGGEIGSMDIPAINSGDFTILNFEWTPPNPADYPSIGGDPMICYLARIESLEDPITGEEFGPIANNVKESNNIATVNYSLVDIDPLNSVFPTQSYYLNNPTNKSVSLNILLEDISNTNGSFFDEGSIEIDLVTVLGNGKTRNYRKIKFDSLKDLEQLENIVLPPNGLIVASFKFIHPVHKLSAGSESRMFRLRLTNQYESRRIEGTNFDIDIRVNGK